MTLGGYGGWRDIGGYELKGNHLLMLDDLALKGELEQIKRKEKPATDEALMAIGMHTYNWTKK